MICLWPRDSHGLRKLWEHLCVLTIVLIFISFLAIPNLCWLSKQTEFIAIIDNFAYPISFVNIVLKILVIHGKRNVLLPVLNMIAEDWAKSKTDKERAVMFRYARIARVVNKFSCVAGAVSLTPIIVLPIFGVRMRHTTGEIDRFPIPADYAYDVSRSPYYEMIYVAQIMMLWVMLMCYSGIDMFFGTVVLHICGQAENLRARIASERRFENFQQALAAIVSDHTRLSRAVDVIENTFTVILLIVMLFFGVISCMYSTEIISMIAEKDTFSSMRVLFMLLAISSSFIQMSFYFIAGQALENQSQGIYDATYECEWLNLKSNEMRSLLLVMTKSKKPLFVTAGKLFPMTMLTFGNITKICFSYISFLLTKL
nr:odorant receptor Or2-like [Nomia melanderi]